MMDDLEKTLSAGDLQPEATQIFAQPAAESTQMAVSVECPVCHSQNAPSETYCTDCGFLLSSKPEEQVELAELQPVAMLVSRDGLREFALHEGENTVGRQDADVLLTHNTVSRRHALITVEDGKAYVEDLGSTNGTYVSGKKLEPGEKVEVADGTEVVFGSQTLLFKLAAPPVLELDEIAGDSRCAQAAAESPEVSLEMPESKEEEAVAKLVSKDGSLSFLLKQKVYSIGRREGNDIVIPDPYCSGRHAELRASEDSFQITDLGSTNGTLVNGVRIEPNSPTEIRIGDEVTVGNTVLRLEAVQ